MRYPLTASLLLLLATLGACTDVLPPPPVLTVTSPHRGLIQESGRITVTGRAVPGPTGEPVVKVSVNDVAATLAADGSFTAVVDVPSGATLVETIATSNAGSRAIDARAVQIGQRRPIDAGIDRAVSVALSTEVFAKISAEASAYIKTLDVQAMLAPLQPMANVGDSVANMKLSITRLALGDVTFSLTPVDGGLELSAQFNALNLGANAVYGGYLVPDGSTAISATADQVTISGILAVTPNGTMGFKTTVASPTVRTTNLKIQASGLVGDVLDLLDGALGSTIQSLISKTAEGALEPLLNTAVGALAGPKHIDVLGQRVELEASPSAISFSRAGALVTLNLRATIEGSESSPGYVFTQNGAPTLTVGSGVQVAIADDLLNQMLAQVHALGLLNYRLQEDFGLFDAVDIKLALPPMISANNQDGSVRLVLGDMVASFTDGGTQVLSAVVNASVDLEVQRGATAQEIALQFGTVDVFVNVTGDVADHGEMAGDLVEAAGAGIAVQLDSLEKFMITLPVPSVANMTLDTLALRADNGYIVASGQVH